ncbi:Rz-like lysis system protein LysB [Pseudomonas subflava]|uniref:Rz-like lysis system protein LysB n=1 Tax=Pseudomonas subflava TaxID=2952933 RepID=UPI00207983E3|nr:Rz-like lysis system protein LysB [Pseudomonas subflava]
MTTLRQALYGAALLAALALLIWGGYQRLQAELGRSALAQERLANTNARIERDATTITTLHTTLSSERQAQASLQQTSQDLRRELDVRKQQIKELKRENAELREWAAAQLPVAARRLRQRPAITGADGYRNWLSGRDALHPERD